MVSILEFPVTMSLFLSDLSWFIRINWPFIQQDRFCETQGKFMRISSFVSGHSAWPGWFRKGLDSKPIDEIDQRDLLSSKSISALIIIIMKVRLHLKQNHFAMILQVFCKYCKHCKMRIIPFVVLMEEEKNVQVRQPGVLPGLLLLSTTLRRRLFGPTIVISKH